MKTTLLTFGLLACIASSFAQTQEIEIHRSDISYPNANFHFQVDTNVTLDNSFQASGKNQRWDFSTLNSNRNFITQFLTPDSENGGDQIDGCNMVIKGRLRNDDFAHMELNNEAFSANLNAQFSTSNVVGSGPKFKTRELIFPLAYGMAWTDSARSTGIAYPGSDFGVSMDSVRVDIFILYNYSCDGYGQLILPFDSVPALRIKQDLFYEYEVVAYKANMGWFTIQSASESKLSYNFINKEGGYFAATVEYKTDQLNVAQVAYRSGSLLSAKEVEKTPVHLYPNPALNFFQIEAEQSGTLQIMDLQGKLVQAKTELNEGTNQIDIQTLSAGQYLVVLNYSDGSTAFSRMIKK